MPCIKCSNGRWRYGNRGRCQFDTLAACRRAEQAINIEKPKKAKTLESENTKSCCPECEHKQS